MTHKNELSKSWSIEKGAVCDKEKKVNFCELVQLIIRAVHTRCLTSPALPLE